MLRMNTADMANFRPVSNLSFLSKVTERVVAQRLKEYLTQNNLLPRCQSAYRRHHSTETAMLRVISDALPAADARYVKLLGMVDLSAAFDCVDHPLLLERLQRTFGLTGDALRWMTSFVTGRTQQVVYNGQLSPIELLRYGVPQGSVLGLYTADVSQIATNHGLSQHQYADDCQVYLSVQVQDAALAATRLSSCITDIAAWMSSSRLRLNPSKTVVIWLGSRQQVGKSDVHAVPILNASDFKSRHSTRSWRRPRL